MENITMNPMTIPSCWQLALSSLDQATSVLATLAVQGIAVRPVTNAAPVAFAAGAAVVATDVKRDRAAGTDHDGTTVAIPGLPAWSPPN